MALTHVRSVARPSTLGEAWNEKAARGEAARFFGGGIDVVLFTPPTVHTLIDLAGLDLRGVSQAGGGLEIGALTTMSDALHSPAVEAFANGYLGQVLRRVASPLQRNLGTLGGTIASAHPWSDVIPALLALDAELRIFSGESRSIRLEEFLADRAACCEAIIEAILLPMGAGERVATYHSFTRTAFDISLLNVACSAHVDQGVWRDVRVVVGGRPGLAARQTSVEVRLEGAKPADLDLAAVARDASEQVDVRDDIRASAAYRRTLVDTLLLRCLKVLGGGGNSE